MSDRHLDIVMIPSTQCNLRCAYCYEMTRLGDKRRMSLDMLEIVFERLARFFEERRLNSARFIWHGGEPLLLPPEYYLRAFELQRQYFGNAGTPYQNSTQTNLTVLDAERIELLRSGFDSVGVSLDLFGSLRINVAGRAVEPKVIDNLDRLLADGVQLGGITVLTRGNRRRMADVYRFYRARNMRFRLLPLHTGEFTPGQWFEISAADTLRAFCELADLWLADDGAPNIHPIVETIQRVYANLTEGRNFEAYDPQREPRVIAIDREGFVSSYENILDRTRSYGCLLENPLAALLGSENCQRLSDQLALRLRNTCHACPHHGRTCSGYPMAEGANEYWDQNPDGTPRCNTFAGLIDHVAARLRAAGVGAGNDHPGLSSSL